MDKIKEIEINNLIDLRKCYYTTVVLITTGILGLFFIEISKIKIIIMLIIGCYFDYIFFNKFLEVNSQIRELIKRI